MHSVKVKLRTAHTACTTALNLSLAFSPALPNMALLMPPWLLQRMREQAATTGHGGGNLNVCEKDMEERHGQAWHGCLMPAWALLCMREQAGTTGHRGGNLNVCEKDMEERHGQAWHGCLIPAWALLCMREQARGSRTWRWQLEQVSQNHFMAPWAHITTAHV